mmetsp:Transcript_91157/g.258147  ORF Transcript_91157/g.258147 Transcript_91157/m.258147 type:complete len:193 (-) Transcript_91157:88-666(-)
MGTCNGRYCPERTLVVTDIGPLAAKEQIYGKGTQHAPNLRVIMECHQPLIHKLASFIVESPRDIVQFSLLAYPMAAQLELTANDLWGRLYEERWPAYHEFLLLQGPQDWYSLYRDTYAGAACWILEVFAGLRHARTQSRLHYGAPGTPVEDAIEYECDSCAELIDDGFANEDCATGAALKGVRILAGTVPPL